MAAMAAAGSIEDMEIEWRSYLNHIEKVWVKVERCCQHARGTFEPWQGGYRKLRREDPLLRYLKQCRDADNHSIQDLAAVEPGSWGINPAFGNTLHINRLEIRNGRIAHYSGSPIKIEVMPPQPIVVRVKNHGEWHDPPKIHLGKSVNTANPLFLARAGLDFYEGYIEAACKKFFDAHNT
jgi:hypothetical protein